MFYVSKSDTKITKSRTRSLLGMAAKIAIKESSSFLKKKTEDRLAKMISQADIVVDHVGRLKGAAMKAVQMLTIEGQDFLPPEVIQVLEKLQSQAPRISDDIMIGVLKSELGEERFQKIQNLSQSPMAAASIGQVYKGQVDQNDVVIKVQYPEISESIDSDLKTLKKLLSSLLFISRKDIPLDEVFEELSRVLKLETNYLLEAENLVSYRHFFADQSQYIVPKVFKDLTTQKVITLEYLEGKEFTHWLSDNPSPQDRIDIGKKLLDLYFMEFFENQLVQTDPNPANFLINSKKQIVLLDFGATLRYSNEFVQKYQQLLRTAFQGNSKETLQALIDNQFISGREDHETLKEFTEFIELSLLPFAEDQQPFNFARMDYTDLVRKKALGLTKKIKHSSPPKQIIFLHRKLGGTFFLLKKMNLKIDLASYREKILDTHF